ncbi:MAG: ROK family protein, partial [Candidatus Paceibacterota bacterium]
MFITIDIGGTTTRVASFPRFDGPMDVLDKFPTPDTPKAGMRKITNCLDRHVRWPIKAVVVGIAGVVDAENKKLFSSPNLPTWVGEPLAPYLEDFAELETVYMVNDTDLGGLGEAHEGAGSKKGITAYLTVGTGVGGTRIVDGRIDRSTYGFEPGHQVIDVSDYLAATEASKEGSIRGHLEYYISGRNIEQRTGKSATDIQDEGLWATFENQLVAALNNVIVFWSPDTVVLGGSMIIRNEYISFAYLQKA